MILSSANEGENTDQSLFEIPEEFKIDFLRQRVRISVKDDSLQKLSLSKIIAAARKIQSHELLQRIADYYVENKWLFAAGNIYELIGSPESLQKAEKCYVEGRCYLSAIEVCKTIGTSDALKRAREYGCRTC